MLEQVLERHRIPCPLLSKYVADRDACVRLVFLGSVEAWIVEEGAVGPPPPWTFALRDELRDNAERLVVRPELDDVRRARSGDDGDRRRPLSGPALASVLSVYLHGYFCPNVRNVRNPEDPGGVPGGV